jgi:NAD(P)-dependent dehydrogenase (short-subunit alcohol dehydrogenase family)
MSLLKDNVAVISCGTRGIELAIAGRFLQDGAHVFIFARRRDALGEGCAS